jgi:acetolactate synthase-1/2/3 large subunit
VGSGTSARSGAHLVLETLEREGVDVVFGYPGGAIMPLYDALYGHNVRHVLVRHEAAAAFAAGGYARSSGRVGVCLATSGPGATNLITGILDAMMDSVPLVAITGQVKSTLLGTDAFQEADVAALTHTITKRNIVVRDVTQIIPALRSAFAIARGPRPGPVLVDIPSDILRALYAPENLEHEPERPRAVAPTPDPAAIARAVEAIEKAKRPVIIAGGGLRWADGMDEYRTFVARLGAPHTATLHGLGNPSPDDPNFLGMLGMHGWKRANLAVADADLVVALGMRFDDRVTGNPERFATNAQIIHADVDASEFGKIVNPEIALHADVKETLIALNAALEGRKPSDAHASWAVTTRERGTPPARDRACGGALSATDVLDALFDEIAPGTIVTTDVGQHQMWAAQRVRPSHPRDFMSSGGLGSMGFGFPAAIGAQFAHPGRPVVAIVGDGGFQMSFAELATLRRYGVPVKVLLLDNRNLGMVRQWQQIFFNERYSATSLDDNPDFCMIARAYEIEARTVGARSDLRGAIRAFLQSKVSTLLHCACFPLENVWPMIPSGTSVEESMESVPA